MNPLLYSIMQMLSYSTQLLLELLPYFIFGVIVGELLKFTSWTKLIYRGINKSPMLSTVFAVVLGMASPLCTYGTVPVMLQLYRAGVPPAPLVAFLSSSALMNPQLFIMTWGGISAEMAIARVLAVLVFGILLGFILQRIPLKWITNPNLIVNKNEAEEILNRPPKKFNFKLLLKNSIESMEYISFYLIIGILIGAAVEVFTPNNWLSSFFEYNSWQEILLSSLAGVPMYVCGGGSIGFLKPFIEQGMAKGAVLAFFIVGPAARPVSIMAIATILRPVFIVLYIISLIVFSLFVGLIYR